MSSNSNFKPYYLWYSEKYLQRQPIHIKSNKNKHTQINKNTSNFILDYPTTKIYLSEEGIEYFCTHVTLTEDSKPLFNDTILIAHTNCIWYKPGNKYCHGKIYYE
jgi:hypothetical protein